MLLKGETMLGKHFLYLLVRKDELCFKVGISSRFAVKNGRVQKDLKNFGPFGSKSQAIRMDSRKDAKKLEDKIKSTFSHYNFTIPLKQETNGKTEWYPMGCFDDINEYITSQLNSKGFFFEGPETIPVDVFKSSRINKNRQQYITKKIRKTLPLIEIKSSNSKNLKNFSQIYKDALKQNIVGINRRETRDGLEYKLRVKNQHENIGLMTYGKLESKDEKGNYSFANYCNSILSSDNYQDISFRFPNQKLIGQHWTSEEHYQRLISLFNDICDAYPSYVDGIRKDWHFLKAEDVSVFRNEEEVTNTFHKHIFKVELGLERFLPHNMPADVFDIILMQSIDFLSDDRKDAKFEELLLWILSLKLIQTGENSLEFTTQNLFDDLSYSALVVQFESMFREGLLQEYSKPDIYDFFGMENFSFVLSADGFEYMSNINPGA